MTKLMIELHDRYIECRASAKAWTAIVDLYECDMISENEWKWFANKCGGYVWDIEEQRVYNILDDGKWEFAERLTW